MARHKTIQHFLFCKLIEVYCPDSMGRNHYERSWCSEELIFNIAEKLHISWEQVPCERLLFDALNDGFCSGALMEKVASLIFCVIDTGNKEGELKYFLRICKRKQLTSTPCLNRFVQQFFGEKKEENHLPENPKAWLKKCSVKELKWMKTNSTALLKKREKGEGRRRGKRSKKI